MKKNQDRRRAAGIIAGPISLALVVSSALLMTVYAQSVSQQDPVAAVGIASKQLGTVPSSGSSRSKVTLQVTFEDGAVFKVTQYEGSLIRVERNGSRIGIIPHIDTEHGNQVTATILEGFPIEVRDISVLERIAKTSSFEIGRVASDLTRGGLGVKVAVIGIAYEDRTTNEGKKTSRLRLLNDFGRDGGPECCVTCSGNTICGCSVEAPCGNCCVGACCSSGSLGTVMRRPIKRCPALEPGLDFLGIVV